MNATVRSTLALSFLTALACSDAARRDPARPAVEIGSRRLPVSRVEAHLRANLLAPDAENEGAAPEDLDRARSRVLDGLIEEELLLAEAEARGFDVPPGEIDAYLAEGPQGESGATDAAGREEARRNILVDKFREAWLRTAVRIQDADVSAYAASKKDTLAAEWSPQTRIIGFHDDRAASRRLSEWKKNPGAVAALFTEPEPKPNDEDLPDDVRHAIETLAPGAIAGPFAFGAGCVLVARESRPVGAAWDAWLRDAAREQLLREGSEREAARLISGLRERVRVRIHTENLPFHYLPDNPETPQAP